ncbi:DERA protein [Salpingoeca rosetta]|uniref:Deoxyribose-phosphate aldolase n=1 Tax=Salpingoeca rosetta (strain ATCC 50818 / BSB-021) TaxID=946362 RepID=F2U9L4_SALR5|nr:DERA protein [Salpingoeca rosetta]EGD73041.1 DERA protein [Salpingoeca rosetta]|eukprot:XP_004994072.1 DERA protein [Salpingoeca rosetta]
MPHERNPGIPLDLSWVTEGRVNLAATKRRADQHKVRRSVKMEWQAAWLLRAVTCIDLTTLSGDDTEANVKRLCFKAKRPIRRDILETLGVADKKITTGAVCVYPNRVNEAVKHLEGTNIPVASVAAGFPAGQTMLKHRLMEIEEAVAAGAHEIDIVITRPYVLQSKWQQLYDEVKAMRQACGEAHLKTILATGELGSLDNVYRASVICMMAGADVIKTSTGKEGVNATFPVALTMLRAIREYHQRTGFKVGFKPAGGIRSAKDAVSWLAIMKEELGDDWTKPDLFRIGASSLLTDIERQLFHCATGRYAAAHQLAMS